MQTSDRTGSTDHKTRVLLVLRVLVAHPEARNFGWSLLLGMALFSPYLFTLNPHYNFFGDLAILYFPQFVEGYHMSKAGAAVGIDFLTGSGATGYFLRPNIPTYYPPYHLAYMALTLDTIEGLARSFVWIMCAHAVAAMYFSIRVARRHFQMDSGAALLFAVMYMGAISYTAFPTPPFFYVAALFPCLLCVALDSVEAPIVWWRVPLQALPYVLVFLSGYIPLDINAAAVALIFTFVYSWQKEPNARPETASLLARLFAPPVLATCVVILLYFSIVMYNTLVPEGARGVWHAAHHWSFESKDIFSLFSRAFPSSNPGTGVPFVRLGPGVLLLLAIAYALRRQLVLNAQEQILVGFSFFLFAFYLLLSFGQATGLPDMFYFLVPVLGGMHLYGRYLLIAAFFLFLAVCILFKHAMQTRENLSGGRWLVVILVLMLVGEGFGQSSLPQWINLRLFVVELLMLALMFAAFASRQRWLALVGVIGIMFLTHAANFNSYIGAFTQGAGGPYRNDVAFSDERKAALFAYVKKNSTKTLVKYVDITDGIEKSNGLLLNFPWMVRDRVYLSNYMGYEPHLAVDKEYWKKYQHPYIGQVNMPWVLRTGADFIVFNQAAWAAQGPGLEVWIDRTVPELDLWYGYRIAKLKDASGLIAGIPPRHQNDFDNGIVRVSNPAGTARVSGFETDMASSVRFRLESPEPTLVRFALFANKLMELRVDGARSNAAPVDGLIEFILPAGPHEVEYVYKNLPHEAFIIVFRLYLGLLFGIVTWRLWLLVRGSRGAREQART